MDPRLGPTTKARFNDKLLSWVLKLSWDRKNFAKQWVSTHFRYIIKQLFNNKIILNLLNTIKIQFLVRRLVQFNHKCTTNYRLTIDEMIICWYKIIKQLSSIGLLYFSSSAGPRKFSQGNKGLKIITENRSSHESSISNDLISRCRRFSEKPSPSWCFEQCDFNDPDEM